MAVILHNLVGLLHACHGDLLRLSRPRADLHHGRHRPDGRRQAPPAHRLDPHRAGAGQRGARLRQMGLPADLDRRRAGILRARLFDHDDRAARPDLHVLRRGAAGGAADQRRCRCRRRRGRDAGADGARSARASQRSPTSCSRPSIPVLLPEYAGRARRRLRRHRGAGRNRRRRGVGRQQRAQFPQQASALPEHGQGVAQAHRSDPRPRREDWEKPTHRRPHQRARRSAPHYPPPANAISSRSASPRSASANGRWTIAACSRARCARSATPRSASPN